MGGDAGTAKSSLLKWVRAAAPRGVYLSASTSSAAGLMVSRSPHGNDFEPGALVSAGDGVCCIDGVDSLADTAAASLREALECQAITLATAGVSRKLGVKASVLAAAS